MKDPITSMFLVPYGGKCKVPISFLFNFYRLKGANDKMVDKDKDKAAEKFPVICAFHGTNGRANSYSSLWQQKDHEYLTTFQLFSYH